MDINQFNQSFTESDWENHLSAFGWRLSSPKKFLRPGKQGLGCSGALQERDGILFFKNFSSNTNLEKTTHGKDFYSPFEFLLSNIYNGDKKRAFSELKLNLDSQTSIKTVTRTVERQITGCYHLQYEFAESSLQQQSIELETTFKFERWQADKEIIRKFPDAKRERVYRIAFNNTTINKGEKNNVDWGQWTNSFENSNFTLTQIFDFIGEGYSIYPGHLQFSKKSKNKDNFLCSELIFLDIEKSDKQPEIYSIEDFIGLQPPGLIGIYTSFNHKEHEPRYRALFELPFVIYNIVDYEGLIKRNIVKYKADANCNDASRAYFGNNNGKCFNFITGEICQYLNGVTNGNA